MIAVVIILEPTSLWSVILKFLIGSFRETVTDFGQFSPLPENITHLLISQLHLDYFDFYPGYSKWPAYIGNPDIRGLKQMSNFEIKSFG